MRVSSKARAPKATRPTRGRYWTDLFQSTTEMSLRAAIDYRNELPCAPDPIPKCCKATMEILCTYGVRLAHNGGVPGVSGGESKRLRTPNLNFEREHVSRERLDPGAFGSCIAAVGAPKLHIHIHTHTYTHIYTQARRTLRNYQNSSAIGESV